MTMKYPPITNCWGKVPVKPLKVAHSWVFRGQPGIAFNHQAQLTTHQGQLVASWTLGVRDEEGPGEDMVFSVSEDRGGTWSPPKVIACAQPGRRAKTVVVSSGIRSVRDAMVAYCGHWDRTPEGILADGNRTPTNDPAGRLFADLRTEARVSRDGGASWSAPVVVAPDLSNYMPPFATRSGRLVLPGNLTYRWTDDPMGLKDWHWAGVPGMHEGIMDNYFNMFQINELAGTGQLFNEACCYQLADGTLRMMLRNETSVMKENVSTRLGACESRDNGLTWSKPELTDYTDAVCRAHFGRLPDGRFFGMSCPNPGAGWAPRTPAILALSADGNMFDRHYLIGDDRDIPLRYSGLFKGGRYGYPYLHTDEEFGYVIYSVNKEDIAVGRFCLEDLR